MTPSEAAAAVQAAKSAEDVLGPNDEERPHRLRELSKLLHPDAGGDGVAFARLQELLAVEAKKAQAKAGVFQIASKIRTYDVNGLAFRGRIANLYRCTYIRDGATKEGLLKLPRSPKDNDLMQAEGSALRRVRDSDDDRRVFYVRLEDSFKHRDVDTRADRRAHVTRALDGFVSLAEVREVYPEGIDARDLAWMWRRAYAAVSLLHELGMVHGALVPEHILIHPEQHGLQLCGLTSSVEIGGTIKALGGRSYLYPPEVLRKQPVDTTTDLYTLGKTMESMLRLDQPRQFFSFIKGCTFERQAARPQDAKELLGELDDLLHRLYGPRKFREFKMPARA